jgi:hypothetical protein
MDNAIFINIRVFHTAESNTNIEFGKGQGKENELGEEQE